METIKRELTEEERHQNRVALAEYLLESKRQTIREMRESYEKDPHIRKIIAEISEKNAKKPALPEQTPKIPCSRF